MLGRSWLGPAMAAWIACACGDAAAPVVGEEGGSCYPNDTCDGRLRCLSDLCVEDEERERDDLDRPGPPPPYDDDGPPDQDDGSRVDPPAGPACTNEQCHAREQLCDGRESSASLGQCVSPELVTNWCQVAGMNEGRELGGPILFDGDFERDGDMDEVCSTWVAGSTAWWLLFSYFDPTGDAYGEGEEPVADSNIFIAEQDGTLALHAELSISGSGAEGAVAALLCFEAPVPTIMGLQSEDKSGRRSNRACVAR